MPIPLYLFTRAPVPGAVKTRLQPMLGKRRAAAVAEYMLQQTLATMAGHWPGSLILAVTPTLEHPLFHELTAAYNLPLLLQQGEDLGARMLHVLQAGIAEAGCAAVVGSDIPQIDSAILRHAHALMMQDKNVIGPTADGGFYLLGLQRATGALFDGVNWGTAEVREQVLCRGETLGIGFSTLPELRDIDTPDDLAWLALERKEYLEYL